MIELPKRLEIYFSPEVTLRTFYSGAISFSAEKYHDYFQRMAKLTFCQQSPNEDFNIRATLAKIYGSNNQEINLSSQSSPIYGQIEKLHIRFRELVVQAEDSHDSSVGRVKVFRSIDQGCFGYGKIEGRGENSLRELRLPISLIERIELITPKLVWPE
jgi:hypothetical protein